MYITCSRESGSIFGGVNSSLFIILAFLGVVLMLVVMYWERIMRKRRVACRESVLKFNFTRTIICQKDPTITNKIKVPRALLAKRGNNGRKKVISTLKRKITMRR